MVIFSSLATIRKYFRTLSSMSNTPYHDLLLIILYLYLCDFQHSWVQDMRVRHFNDAHKVTISMVTDHLLRVNP